MIYSFKYRGEALISLIIRLEQKYRWYFDKMKNRTKSWMKIKVIYYKNKKKYSIILQSKAYYIIKISKHTHTLTQKG